MAANLEMQVTSTAASAADLVTARTQMAVSLGWHIVVACLGVGFPLLVLVAEWRGLTAYALLGGADFGAGFWDLLAGGAHGGARQRALIEQSIGPVWEANHVWLIFALVMLWTGFPTAFAAIMSTLYIPLTAVALGVILRGAAFAFRKAVPELWLKRIFGACFAASSVITPFFLGTAAGAVATGRVPPGTARGDPVASWVNPTSLLGGILAVGVCAYLAAVYLTNDAHRTRNQDLVEWLRVRALAAGVVVGLVAAGGIWVLRADAPRLFDGLTGRALPLVVASAVFGAASLLLLLRRRLVAVRVTAALAVAAIVWGWAAGQYPYLLDPDLTIAQAASGRATMQAVLASLAVGSLLLVPSLALLFTLFQRQHHQQLQPAADAGEPSGLAGSPGPQPRRTGGPSPGQGSTDQRGKGAQIQ